MPEPQIDLSARALLVAASFDALYPPDGDGGPVADWIRERRDDLGLIYFHNHPAGQFQSMLVDRDLPRPDATISDEGGSVQLGAHLRHLDVVEEEMTEGWAGRAAVREALPDELPVRFLRGGGEYCIKMVLPDGPGGVDALEELQLVAGRVGARVRVLDEHVELVPAKRNPATALMALLPHLGVSQAWTKRRLLLVPNTKLQSRLMYLGYRSIVSANSAPATQRRARTAPKAFFSETLAAHAFFEGLRHHFGWRSGVRLRGALA